jgi:hypothetical protein
LLKSARPIADAPIMPFMRGSSPDDVRTSEAGARASVALRALDAFTFWVMPSPVSRTGDLVVVGATGAFLVRPCGMEGALTFGPTSGIVGGRNVPAIRDLKRSAKALQSKLSNAAVYVSVEPMVCLTHALAGTPRTLRGVRYVHVKDLAADVGARAVSLQRGRAQRAARALGMSIAGDDERHFSPR